MQDFITILAIYTRLFIF